MGRLDRGFALIEMVIVIAIIGALAVMAFSAYRDYTVRARVAEAIVAVARYKVAVAENVDGQVALDAKACSNVDTISASTSNIQSITCHDAGVLRVETTAYAGGVILEFSPDFSKEGGTHLGLWFIERKRPSRSGGLPSRLIWLLNAIAGVPSSRCAVTCGRE